jgi:hypothetical protein
MNLSGSRSMLAGFEPALLMIAGLNVAMGCFGSWLYHNPVSQLNSLSTKHDGYSLPQLPIYSIRNDNPAACAPQADGRTGD